MSGKHNSYGSISRGNSSRRRRKRRNDTIRIVLSVCLVGILILAVGFLGVSALKGTSKPEDQKETKGTDHTIENSKPEETEHPCETVEISTSEENHATDSSDEQPQTVSKTHVVWLDAGHGGYDLGSSEWKRDDQGNIIDKDGQIVDDSNKDDLTARGIPIVREKEDTLLLTLAIQKALEDRGVSVLMTRTDDSATTVQERAEKANQSDAECFISIHRNYMIGDTKTSGIEALLVNEKTRSEIPGKEKDEDLLGFIFDELAKEETNGIHGFKREKVGVPDYAVLWRTNMPSIILEMGYMTNSSDNELFRSHIDQYARAIADGIVKWLNTQN